jgi:hypothetical protein
LAPAAGAGACPTIGVEAGSDAVTGSVLMTTGALAIALARAPAAVEPARTGACPG